MSTLKQGIFSTIKTPIAAGYSRELLLEIMEKYHSCVTGRDRTYTFDSDIHWLCGQIIHDNVAFPGGARFGKNSLLGKFLHQQFPDGHAVWRYVRTQ